MVRRLSRLLLFLLLLSTGVASAQRRPSHSKISAYICRYKEEAKKQMLRYHIPASVILAQAIFESAAGSSELARRSNNHFGIKCHAIWIGDTVKKSDDRDHECFRKYLKVSDSFEDHSIFLMTRQRYTHLFSLPLTDFEGWCEGLKRSGYATYSSYAEELISLIKDYRLYELDAVERMAPRHLAAVRNVQLKPSTVDQQPVSLEEFSNLALLFSREEDFVLRSLKVMGPGSGSRILARK